MLSRMVPFFAPTGPAGPYHTFTVGVAAGRGVRGYWDGRVGTIASAQYALPNGTQATVRQAMVKDPLGASGPLGDTEFRFLLNAAGLTTADTDQFPSRITAQNGANVVTFTPMDPDEIGSFGQGIGRDYMGVTADITAVFVVGATVTIELHYD